LTGDLHKAIVDQECQKFTGSFVAFCSPFPQS
jgi:hypothetical protein